jgi:hypothetical protein
MIAQNDWDRSLSTSDKSFHTVKNILTYAVECLHAGLKGTLDFFFTPLNRRSLLETGLLPVTESLSMYLIVNSKGSETLRIIL